jgi:AraC-like DNA-binding protein
MEVNHGRTPHAGRPSFAAQPTDLDMDSRCRLSTQDSHRDAIVCVISALREHLREPWTLQGMARLANMSRFYFCRVFTDVVGTSPRRFLASTRIGEAKRLLLATDLSITEVCMEVGYESVGTFTHRFTASVGVPPSSFREARHPASTARSPGGPALSDAGTVTERPPAVVTGSVSGKHHGTIFIGLFPERLVHGQPVGCAMLAGPGPYRIVTAAQGAHYVHAFSPNIDEGFWPEVVLPSSSATVGSSEEVITVPGGATRQADILLRHLKPLDPPILVSVSAQLRQLAAM